MSDVSSQDVEFVAGTQGLCRLLGSNQVFEFSCKSNKVILDNIIESPTNVFKELLAEVLWVDLKAKNKNSRARKNQR